MIPSDHDPPVEAQPSSCALVAVAALVGIVFALALGWLAMEIADLFVS